MSAKKKFLAGLAPLKTEAPAKRELFLSIVATTNLCATKGKKTAECLVDSRYVHRDNFKNWLGKYQSDASACTVSACVVNKDWTFAEAVSALPYVMQTDDVVRIGHAIIACGYTLTLQQVEDLVERTRRGEKTGLLTNWRNFFFIETDDPKNLVLVGGIDSSVGRSLDSCHIHKLSDGLRWRSENPLLLCNMDASKL